MKIHAAHDAPAVVEGRCAYSWHWEDVSLWCSDEAIPGQLMCASHFIEHAQARADAGIPPATPVAVAADLDRRGVSG